MFSEFFLKIELLNSSYERFFCCFILQFLFFFPVGVQVRVSFDTNYGLFRQCVDTKGVTACVSHPDNFVSDKWRATQAFMILSVLVSIGAVVCGIIHMVSEKMQAKIISLVLMIAFAFALVGLAIFTANKEDKFEGLDYGWAYGLGWVGALASLIVGIVVLAVFR